jgi:hypothetical protein
VFWRRGCDEGQFVAMGIEPHGPQRPLKAFYG